MRYLKQAFFSKSTVFVVSILSLLACESPKQETESKADEVDSGNTYYGTLEPFASEAIYFAMTDRFVDGDPTNNHPEQGGEFNSWQKPLTGPSGKKAFVGYMGGDFQGVLNNAKYIKDMGFTAIWLTPIVDNPDAAFSGGEKIEFGGAFKDGGKTGYHGYWGVNFFVEDEHLVSEKLKYKDLTSQLKNEFQIKTILDIVANHGAPAFSMPDGEQDKYGKLYDRHGIVIADHQNLEPEKLEPSNPLHQFYNTKKDIMQLSDFNENNPAVLEYFVDAYSQWIEHGAAAFRIDTIKHMPHHFWKKFSDRIREENPGFFMFAESYSFDANFIAEHTQPENGGISVLDFPGREAMLKVFENKNGNYQDLLTYLHLQNGPYKNPYELTTFYDNHDMSRINTDENGYIDIHNWLFTSRGIPVIYYGSEIGFMSGTSEHQGNRNYLGQERIDLAKTHPIKIALSRIANLRKSSIALQKGLQVNLSFDGDQAAFYRVFENQGTNQTALVLLNKGDQSYTFEIDKYLSAGEWRDSLTGAKTQVTDKLSRLVSPHGVAVLFFDDATTNTAMIGQLEQLMEVHREGH